MVDSLNPSAATLALALAGNGALDGKKAPEAGNGVDVPSPPGPRSQPRSQRDEQCPCGADPTGERVIVGHTLSDTGEREGMLRNSQDLEGYTIGATDGVIGEVEDFYFDDEAWVIRYLVVSTGNGFRIERY